MATPGRFILFFEELASLNAGRSARIWLDQSLANDYGIELVGPPLS